MAAGSGSDGQPMEEALPDAFAELAAVFDRLEAHYRDMQDIEFTVQQRQAVHPADPQRQAHGAGGAEDRRRHGGRRADQRSEEAVLRVDPASLDQLLHPTLDPKAERKVIAKGLPASPGAVSGKVVFTADDAEQLAAAGEAVILVRIETSPDDIHGMHAAKGILTSRGGMTSHAAVVARGMGKACVCGAGDLAIDLCRAARSPAKGVTRRRGRGDHHRRRRRHGDAGRGADRRPAALGRLRDADGLGRRAPPAQGAHQRRDAARRPHRGHASAPRASACAAPSTCSSSPTASSPCAR